MGVIKRFIIFCIKLISQGFRWNQPRACRFYPSCSKYSEQAFRDFGIVKAAWLTVYRLARCHPFSSGGYDPLPHSHLASQKV